MNVDTHKAKKGSAYGLLIVLCMQIKNWGNGSINGGVITVHSLEEGGGGFASLTPRSRHELNRSLSVCFTTIARATVHETWILHVSVEIM